MKTKGVLCPFAIFRLLTHKKEYVLDLLKELVA